MAVRDRAAERIACLAHEMLDECTEMAGTDCPDENDLRRCREEIRRLTAENQELRRVATFLGDLAERLNQSLNAERRLDSPRFESTTNS